MGDDHESGPSCGCNLRNNLACSSVSLICGLNNIHSSRDGRPFSFSARSTTSLVCLFLLIGSSLQSGEKGSLIANRIWAVS